jgi:putative spermidine/putrescine transport system permease protein
MRRDPSSYPLTWHLMDILEAFFSKILPKGGGLWNPYLMLSPAILLIGILVLGLGYIGDTSLRTLQHC